MLDRSGRDRAKMVLVGSLLAVAAEKSAPMQHPWSFFTLPLIAIRNSTLSDARSKLVIVGIGDDGLAGLTEPARKVVLSADLILGAPSTLALLA